MHPPDATFTSDLRPAEAVYGRREHRGKTKDLVRYETCLAQRSCEVAGYCMNNYIPFLIVRAASNIKLPDHDDLQKAGCSFIARGDHMLVTNAPALRVAANIKSEVNLHNHIFNADVLQDVWEYVVKVKPRSSPLEHSPT